METYCPYKECSRALRCARYLTPSLAREMQDKQLWVFVAPPECIQENKKGVFKETQENITP